MAKLPENFSLGASREELVEAIASWLQHIDRLDEIWGAKANFPEQNPLWDAGEAIRREFGKANGRPNRP